MARSRKMETTRKVAGKKLENVSHEPNLELEHRELMDNQQADVPMPETSGETEVVKNNRIGESVVEENVSRMAQEPHVTGPASPEPSEGLEKVGMDGCLVIPYRRGWRWTLRQSKAVLDGLGVGVEKFRGKVRESLSDWKRSLDERRQIAKENALVKAQERAEREAEDDRKRAERETHERELEALRAEQLKNEVRLAELRVEEARLKAQERQAEQVAHVVPSHQELNSRPTSAPPASTRQEVSASNEIPASVPLADVSSGGATGTQKQGACPQCGAVLALNARFCRKCGARIYV